MVAYYSEWLSAGLTRMRSAYITERQLFRSALHGVCQAPYLRYKTVLFTHVAERRRSMDLFLPILLILFSATHCLSSPQVTLNGSIISGRTINFGGSKQEFFGGVSLDYPALC